MVENLEEFETAGESPAVVRYDFDDTFQKKIVALAIRDSVFMSRTEGLVQTNYFENDADRILFSIVEAFYLTYKKAPSLSSMPVLIKKAVDDKKIRGDLVKEVVERFKEIKTQDISDGEFVTAEIASFARHRAIESAILKSVSALDKRDYDSIESIIRKAMDVGTSDDLAGYDYYEEIDNRTVERVDILAGVIKKDGISTGFAELDKYLYHEGWGRKELSVLMGAAKAGKSMSLGEFAKNASLLGFNVLYVTLEVSAKIISERLDANLSDTLIRLVKDHPTTVATKINKIKTNPELGKLFLHEYPSGTCKPSQIRRLIESYRRKGVILDLVVVDYADIMAPERYTGEVTQDLKSIYIDLRGMAFQYNIAMLTATQTNREGAKSAVAKMTDVAEDFNKIRIADIVISINALEEERKAGEARLFFAASRNSEDGFVIRVKQDRERMKFITKIVGRE